MSEVRVRGASDDLIEIEGAIDEEFAVSYDKPQALLAFSDGTVLRIEYGRTGVWRIFTVATGSAVHIHEPASEDDEDNYSDVATLRGDIRWVVIGSEIARAARLSADQEGGQQ